MYTIWNVYWNMGDLTHFSQRNREDPIGKEEMRKWGYHKSIVHDPKSTWEKMLPACIQ
jgi:hypothetical protein